MPCRRRGGCGVWSGGRVRRRSACGEGIEGSGTREGGIVRHGGLHGFLRNGRVQEPVRRAGTRICCYVFGAFAFFSST